MSEHPPLGFRQIHLDFHTSEHIPGVGAAFDPDGFADVLQAAAVDSVTCFARCHHGYVYFPSKKHPERIHPQLDRPDLLNRQIEACHQRGISVPIYISVQLDHFAAQRHPEWLCIAPDASMRGGGGNVFSPGFYRLLDVLHPGYRAFLAEHTREVLETLDVDGIFFDIVTPQPSCAPHWIEAMDAAGLDPENDHARAAFSRRVIDDWKRETTEMIRSLDRDCTIFYNSGHVGPRHRETIDAFTHYELESLPSGGWGYLHFPLSVRYARNLGKPCIGMTGKFQTSWGDFHSYKNAAALQYECFTMLSHGAGCSVGDQLHPRGEIDQATYDLIGRVYRSVRDKQPWCESATPVADIAVITPEAFQGSSGSYVIQAGEHPKAGLGLTRMFEELKLQFDVLDPGHDLSGYRLVVLPDRVPVDNALRLKLEMYLAEGGAVLASYASGLDAGGERFTLDSLGVERLGEADESPDFIVPGGGIGSALSSVPHVMYQRGLKVRATTGEVLCGTQRPYFERHWRHFCSHRHTPSSGEPGGPGVIANGRCVYFAHPVFEEYYASAGNWVKCVVGDAIDRLVSEKSITVEGPSTLRATLMRQADQGRHVVHLLHYMPEKRAENFEVIEEAIPLHEIPVTLKLNAPATAAKLVPQDEPLTMENTKEGGQRLIVPRLDGHQMIEVS